MGDPIPQTPEHQEQPKNGLPIISQETRDAIIQESGLESRQYDYHKSFDYVLSVFYDVATSSSGFVKALKESTPTQRDVDEGVKKHQRDISAAGMALVLRAFQKESNYRLFGDLAKLTPENIQSLIVRREVDESAQDIFDKALSIPSIPEHQTYLTDLLSTASRNDPVVFPSTARVSAAYMYKTMENVWQRLYPGQNPNTPPSSETQPPTTPLPPTEPPLGPTTPPGTV